MAPNLSASADFVFGWRHQCWRDVGGIVLCEQPNPAHAQRELCVLILYLHSPVPKGLQHDTCPWHCPDPWGLGITAIWNSQVIFHPWIHKLYELYETGKAANRDRLYCVDHPKLGGCQNSFQEPTLDGPRPTLEHQARQPNPTRMQILSPPPVFQGQINPRRLHIEILGSSSQVNIRTIRWSSCLNHIHGHIWAGWEWIWSNTQPFTLTILLFPASQFIWIYFFYRVLYLIWRVRFKEESCWISDFTWVYIDKWWSRGITFWSFTVNLVWIKMSSTEMGRWV